MKGQLDLSSVLSVLLVALAVAVLNPLVGEATDPCGAVQGNPSPPGDDPEPSIAGTLTNSSTVTPIAGATVSLYVCVEGSSVFVDSTTTNGSGRYGFAELPGPNWYYVAASLTGPLANKSPSGATQNPSPMVDVGEGEPDLDMSFE